MRNETQQKISGYSTQPMNKPWPMLEPSPKFQTRMNYISQSQKIFTYSFPDQITLTAIGSGVKSKSNKWSHHAFHPHPADYRRHPQNRNRIFLYRKRRKGIHYLMPGKWARTFQCSELPGRRSKIRQDKNNQKNDGKDRKGGDATAVKS